MTNIYYISGYPGLTEDEFESWYSRKIRKSNSEFPTCKYLVGNASDFDTATQLFLREIGVDPARVYIYAPGYFPNKHSYNIHITDQPTVHMTRDSTCDILWTRPQGDQSAKSIPDSEPEKSIARRRQKYTNGLIPKEKKARGSIYIPTGYDEPK